MLQMAGMAVTEELGVYVGPVDPRLGPDQVARNVFRLFNAVGIRCSEIKKISVNAKAGYAKVELLAKDTENHAVKAIRDVKRVMNFYNLRKLTSKPKYFQVERIGQRAHVSNEGQSNLQNDTEAKETSQSKFQYHYSLAWPSMLKQTGESEDGPGQSEQKPEESEPQPQPQEAETYEAPLEKEHAFDVISLTHDSSSIDSQVGFEELEEENSEPNTTPTIHVATSTSGIPPPEEAPPPVLLDAKTSTPFLPVSFKESGFYHFRQKIVTNMRNVYFDNGDAVSRYNIKYFHCTLRRIICAFLNSGGGVLYFGVRQDAAVVGIHTGSGPRSEDAIRLNIDCCVKDLSPVVPTTDYTVRFAGIMDATGHLMPDVKVLEIMVTPTSTPWRGYSYRGDYYIWRKGEAWCNIGPP